jgi:hypothetical protein
LQTQAEELGIDQGSLANMSKVELAMRSDDPALLNAWQRKKISKSGRVSWCECGMQYILLIKKSVVAFCG